MIWKEAGGRKREREEERNGEDSMCKTALALIGPGSAELCGSGNGAGGSRPGESAMLEVLHSDSSALLTPYRTQKH